MLSCDSLILHLSSHLLRSWSNIPGKLHFDINVDLGFHFLYLRLLCQTFAFSFVQVVQRHYRRYTGRGLFSNQNEFLSFFGLGIVNAPAVIIIKLSVKEESDQRSGLNQKFSF